jgi:uncharacterized protein (TIGR02680 family)
MKSGTDRDSAARGDRFRPTRCGVINLWDYRDEEFVFADGRLVLRGPNGSGKTKALEVLFPFVLDARIEPRRLNPFAGDERTMKSNLLYRGQESAYGYVWMEFRRDASPASDDGSGSGPGEVVTIGAGLRAQRHNDRVSRWYFVVDGQVGRDFSLLGPDDRPLTKRQLTAELEHLPTVATERPVEHRTAVDARLFGLGLGRFEQLITLLLTLRRPQLAKNLDPKGLSRALADGLRPLDEGLIDEAAHSFSDMENVQRTLAGLIQADAAASAFLTGYTTYLRTHARAEADRLTGRLDAIEAARVDLAGALAARARSAADRDAARDRLDQQRDQLRDITSRLDSLKASPAYQDREQLTRQADLTAQLGRAAAQDARVRDGAQADAARREQARATAAAARQEALAAVARRAAELSGAAQDAGIGWDADDNADDGRLGERVAARVAGREDDIAAVRAAITAVAEATRLRDQAQRRLDRTQERLDTAEQALAAAQDAVTAQREQLAGGLSRWLGEHAGILDRLAGGDGRAERAPAAEGSPSDLADSVRVTLTAALDRVGEIDAPTLPAVLDTLLADARQARRDEITRLRGVLDALTEQLAGLRAERALVADEQDQAPPAFAARTGSRDGRPGAPLWALVDFAPDVDDPTAAAIEAALEAANLLDAWVGPAGEPEPGESDTVLLPLPAATRPKRSLLGRHLVAEPDAALPVPPIEAVLASIAVGSAGSAVGSSVGAAPVIDTGGGFRQGIQLGAHHKPNAEYIGATARARRRAKRLAALDTQIEAIEQEVARTDAAALTIRALLDALDAARSALPATAPLAQAVRAVEQQSAKVQAVHGEMDNARSDLDQAIAAHHHRHQSLLALAAARSMPTEPALVDGIAAATAVFGRLAADLGAARRTARERSETLTAADDELLRARERLTEAAEQAELSRTEHQARDEELRTLRAAVGVAVDELDRRIEAAAAEQRAARNAERSAESALQAAIDEAGGRRIAVEGASAAMTTAIAEAQQECVRLRPYARSDVGDVLRLPARLPAWPTAGEQWTDPTRLTGGALEALPQDPDHPVAALPDAVTALYEGILAATGELRPNESSLKSSRTRVSASLTQLQDQLAAAGHEYRPDWEPVDDVIVVKVSDEQGFASIGDFARRIAAARQDQEALLSESEQRILEDALLGRLAQQIHERTTDARDLIAQMNREMRGRRMSSGATVGIAWEQADGLDPQQRAVSRLLDRDASQLSADDLATMRAHFAGRIKDLRAQREDRPYPEILAEALDYRGWRSFVLTLVAPGGQEDRLTQARHSTLSGGEQSVSLHLPLFAAAHVMLSSAAPHCPRLLALDEAFAGIDDAGRSELLGLTAQFDLDLFMTGYDLWATYPTVPGCAHHDLAHSAVEHTVSSLLLVWDGAKILTDGQITGADDDLAAALGSPSTRRRPGDPGGLINLN